MHNDSTNKYKNASKNDDYFNMEEDEKTPNSPPVKLEGILEVMEDLDIGSDESDDAKELMTAIKPLTVRVKSEWFKNKDFDLEYREDSEIGLDEEEDK